MRNKINKVLGTTINDGYFPKKLGSEDQTQEDRLQRAFQPAGAAPSQQQVCIIAPPFLQTPLLILRIEILFARSPYRCSLNASIPRERAKASTKAASKDLNVPSAASELFIFSYSPSAIFGRTRNWHTLIQDLMSKHRAVSLPYLPRDAQG